MKVYSVAWIEVVGNAGAGVSRILSLHCRLLSRQTNHCFSAGLNHQSGQKPRPLDRRDLRDESFDCRPSTQSHIAITVSARAIIELSKFGSIVIHPILRLSERRRAGELALRPD